MELPHLKQVAAVAFLAFVVFRILHKWWFRIKYDWHLIPGPQGYPLIGNLPQLVGWEKPQMHLAVTRLAKEYGKIFKAELPGIGRNLWVTDPEYLQNHITGHGNHGLPKAPLYKALRKLFTPTDNDGIFSTQEMNVRWKVVRKGVSKAFSVEALRAVFPHVLKKADELSDIIKATPVKEPIDVQPLLSRLALDIVGLAGFRIDFKALQDKDCRLFEALMFCSTDMFISTANPFRGMVKWLFPTGKLAQDCKKMYSQLHSEYEWILGELRGRGEPSADDLSLWACLMRLKDPESGAPLDDEAIRPEVATFVTGATDTTAHQIMWVLFIIAALQEVQQKIEAEMKDSGLFQRLRDGSVNRVTYADIAGLNYLLMVVKEGMRMFPVVPLGSVRMTTKDGERVYGYRVPKGTLVNAAFHPLYNAPWLWEEPERFIPERWSNQAPMEASDVEARPEKKSASRRFWAFSDGPRDCVGQRLALMELYTVLAVLLAKFEIRLADRMCGWEGVASRQYNAMALSIDGGMWLNFQPRIDNA
ncbi:unnamed protein product [Ostreobium quekettii]|uniref:Cytochrome P450 n=1 Tax=Ostreobium quekettii TaxID=121088 RepID=A0A8S1IV52_9CHLO|nr:unnamed protein product [Ostreobium quekettii]